MRPSPLFFRLLYPLLSCFLFLLCSGCVGGTPFRELKAFFGTPPQEVATVPPVTPPLSPAVPTLAEPAVPVAIPPTATTPSLPRQPRSSRFRELPDSTYHSRILTEDTTWRGQVLIGGALTVAPQATLVITPGTTVRFRPTPEGGAGLLLIRGRVLATGSSDHPILFTSDEINPAPGDWQGIMVLDSSKKNLLEWCRVEGAVTGISARFSDLLLRQSSFTQCRTGVALVSATLLLSGGGVSECLTGLLNRDGDADLSGGIFSNNGRGIVVNGGSLFLSATEVTGSTGNALVATGARLHLEGNSFDRNGAGVMLTRCRGDLLGNRVEKNGKVGVELVDASLRISGNRIAGNGGVGVMVRSGGGTLWENVLEGNGEGELVVTGSEEVVASANWWGSADPARIRKLIREGSEAKVLFTPFLEVPPR